MRGNIPIVVGQAATGPGNIQVLVKESEHVHIEINGTHVATLWVPPFRSDRPRAKLRDLDLLLASTGITDLAGRDTLWQDCLDWCNDASLGPVSVRCITGRGGSGKSRFALELLHHLRSLTEWDARFVRFEKSEPFDLWARTGGSNHVLLVFDYAPDNVAAIAASLRMLADNPPVNSKRLLRILLLARTADWESGWLSNFNPKDTMQAAQPLRDFFSPDEPIELEPLTVEDRIRVFEQAYQKAAEVLSLETHPIDRSAFRNEHADSTLRDPLTLMMAAIVGLRSGVPNALSLTRIGLAYQTANLLVAERLKHAFPENPALACHMAAYATLTGGIAHDRALAVLKTESEATNLGAVANPSGFVDRLSEWLPGKGGVYLSVVEPDIVGEAFVLGQKAPRLAGPQATILRALEDKDARVIQFLIRATQDFCLAEEESRTEPLEWLEALIAKGHGGDIALLLQIDSALPDFSVVLRPHAVSIRQRIVNSLRDAIANQASSGRPSHQLRSELARQLSNLSVSQSEVGQRGEALATAQEAVKLRRELAQRDRDTFLPDLATSLNNLASTQNEVGQHVEALATGEEAVKLYGELTQRNRDAFLPDLATSLNNLANLQSEVGQPAEALATAQEAVKLYGELAQRNRDAFLPDLAMSLNNLANRQIAVGQRAEALATAQEAVKLRRELAQRNRDAFLPDLAMSLSNLANMQSEVGQYVEALATAQEAVKLYGELAQCNRDAFLAYLAGSLNNLAGRQSEVGQRAEALATAQEAVKLHGELARRNRDAFLPALASSLNNLGRLQSEVGQHGEALATAQEAVKLYRELAQRNRDAFLPALASSLNNLANIQIEVGQRAEALATVQKAVKLHGELARRNRDAFLPALATSCGTLGSVQLRFDMPLQAAQAFSGGLNLLLGFIPEHPFEPHVRLAVRLLQAYLGAAEKAGIDRDRQLMAKVISVLDPYLKQSGEKQ